MLILVLVTELAMEYLHCAVSMILHFFILIISKVEGFCFAEAIFLE